MINKQNFNNLVQKFSEYDKQREALIKKSRDVLKASKQLIYSLHRNDKKAAKTNLASIKTQFNQLTAIAKKDPSLQSEGSFKVAAQEYVEAVCYYGYVVDKKIPTDKALKVSPSHYLLGLFDLTGELVRKAINDAIRGRTESVLEIKQFVEELYGQMIRFDFRESELRRNFDRVSRDLKKLEELVLNLKLKNA